MKTISRRGWLTKLGGAAGLALTATVLAPLLATAEESPNHQHPDTPESRAQSGRNDVMEFLLEFPAGMPLSESQVVLAPKPPKLIQLTSFSIGTHASVAGPGAGNGKAVPLTLQAVKNVNADSPALLAMTGTGQHFDTLTVHVRRRGGAADVVTYTLNTAFIVSMTMKATVSEDGVQETLELAVGTVSAQVPT